MIHSKVLSKKATPSKDVLRGLPFYIVFFCLSFDNLINI
jgi:hypothetical protein